jgi:hypothetical protein
MAAQRNGLSILLAVALAGCAPAPCLLPSQAPMTAITLYFGRGVPGGGQVSEAAWAAFAADVITPRFPNGFTVFDAVGQWRGAAGAPIVHEATKQVEIIIPNSERPEARARLETIAAAYRTRFHQQSVGVFATRGCGAF